MSNLNALKSDKLQQLAYATAAVLLVCHIWQFFDSGYMIEPAIRVVLCLAYLIGALFSRNFLYIYFTVFAYVIVYFNRFQNYTSFFILNFIVYKKSYSKKVIFSLYGLDVLASLLINHRSASHCIVHVLNCIFIYIMFNAVLKPEVTCLDLTDDEEKIIIQLAAGVQQKAINDFSKNTITKKLNEAKERNDCISTAELIYRYKNSSK